SSPFAWPTISIDGEHAAALRLRSAADDLERAQGLVDTAAVALADGRLGDAEAALLQARGFVVAANGELYGGAEIDLLGALPVSSDNLESLRSSVGLAATVIDGGERILRTSQPLESSDGSLEVPLAEGAIPLATVASARREIESLSSALPTQPPASSRFLLGPVEELRDRVWAEADRRRAQLDVLGRGLSLIEELSGGNGDRRYLIAVANTAEMRGSGGMILSYGVLEGRDGDFALPAFGRIDEIALPAALEPADVPGLPADYLARWDGFDPLLRWRSANLSADLTVVGPVMEAMYARATGQDVDGVIQIDPAGLAAILEGTGPVQVAELGVVTADNVEALVLNEAYIRFPGIDERSDVLKEVAEAAFRRLVDGQYDSLRPLAESLVAAVDGRHLMMHASKPRVEGTIRSFAADGALPDPTLLDSVHLSVQNVSGNKLDYYLDTSLQLTGERPGGQLGHLQAEVVVTNTAPPGATSPVYIFGPFNADQQVGLYRGTVTVYLPAGTSLAGVAGDPVRNAPILQSEAGRAVVSWSVDVPAGESRRLVLDLELAPAVPGAYQLVLVPSPRVRPTTIGVDIATDQGRVRGEVVADRPWVLLPEQPPISTARAGT
ncbi:MAG: DUF4012 domain-containing protein, partial [Acidimicrobiales bacterium]